MDEIESLKNVFGNYISKDSSKYIITFYNNISKLINIFEIDVNNPNNNYKYKLDEMIYISKFINESFLCYRINIDIFNKYLLLDKKNIYNILIDFFLYNQFNSTDLNKNILNLIDTLVNSIDISKNIVDYILHKFSYYFYTLDGTENKNFPPKKDYFLKLLQILIHIFGGNYKQINPKNYYFLTKNKYINIPLKKNYSNIGISLWFKCYNNNDKGQILSINLDKNNFIKLNYENNILIVSYNENNFRITKEKILLSNEWNFISFNFKISKKKWIINFLLNDKELLKDYSIDNKTVSNEKNIFISSINIGNDFFGEITTIIINNNDALFNIKTQLNLLNLFPNGILHYKNSQKLIDSIKQIIPSIIYLYSPYGYKYNLINNNKNDLIFENKSNDDNDKSNNIHIFKSVFKKIYLIGGINIILPIVELFYMNKDICVKNKDLMKYFFNLISIILMDRPKNMLDSLNSNFFMMLSVLLEKMPQEIFDEELLKEFIELGAIIFNKNKFCNLYLDYFNHILLNKNIFMKFPGKIQTKIWEYIYNFFEISHKIICPLSKIENLLLNYDQKYLSGEEMCCEEHYNCFIDEYKIDHKRKIMEPKFALRVEKLFLLYEGVININHSKEKSNENCLNHLMSLLALKISPCLTISILNFIKHLFSEEINSKNNTKKNSGKLTKDEIFNIINNNEEYKILIFNLFLHDYIDVKYAALSLLLNIYEYKPKEFKISFEFIKDNILPKKKLSLFNYNNLSPSNEDIKILSKYCIDKANNFNTYNIYNHDDFICSSVFNFSYIYLNYIKFINLFISFLNLHQEVKCEILDILIHINKNLNIEITLEFINTINLYSVSNNSFSKNIFTFIPMLNYFLDILLYYSNFENSNNNIFLSIYNFIINMISLIKEDQTKLTIIDYIIKYYSLLKNRGNDKNNNVSFNIIINNTLNKLMTKMSLNYINNEAFKENYIFLTNLISILFNYIIIFNQDNSLFKAYITKNMNIAFPSFENESSILIFFMKGINVNININDKNSNLLKNIMKDYLIIQNIFDLFNENYNINKYINNKSLKGIKTKAQYIFDNLINNKDLLDNEKIFEIKKIFYYVNDINRSFPLIKIIQYLFEIVIFMCKDKNEFQSLINQYIDFIILIIIFSVRALPENINNKNKIETKLTDNDINIISQDAILFSISFLYEILSTNVLINSNNNLKLEIINKFNEIIYLCYIIYKNGQISKKSKSISLVNSPPFYFFKYYFIKDGNEVSEKNNEKNLKEKEDKLDNIYDIISQDALMNERFYNYGKYYLKNNSRRYINSEILINCAKFRLENDTIDYHHKYIRNANYAIDFDDFEEKCDLIKNKVKKEIKKDLENNQMNLKRKRNKYISLKKNLFKWNGTWSNYELFYKDKIRLKYKIFNHYTKSLLRPFLVPILDIKYYTPKFSKFDENKLFNNNDIEKPKYKNICLDIDKIFSGNNDKDNENDIFELLEEDNSKTTNKSNNINIFGQQRKDKDKDKNVKKNYICCLIKATHHIKGILNLTNEGLTFMKSNEAVVKDEFYDDTRNSCFGSYFAEYPKDKDFLLLNISYSDIVYIFKRLYYYNETGLELITNFNKMYYFNFNSSEIRNSICSKIENKINVKSLDIIINDWKNYRISNMELLMWINIYSNRSYNDISQYPVLPWVIADYDSEILPDKFFCDENNLNSNNNETLFRDLNLPLGMISTLDNGNRKKEYINNLNYSNKIYLKNKTMDNEDESFALSEKPHNYGSHYSNPLYVTHFLSRIFPFSYILIELQGKKFDDPDRLFISVKNSYHNSISQNGDVRELIPEFYYLPEIYKNINNFDMGIRRNKEKVEDVSCPNWSKNDPYRFVTLSNKAFESNYVSSNINNWIDLIFGYKQRGKEAEKCNNVFRYPSYSDLIPIDQMNKEERLYFYRFAEFGICPKQIFKKPFDKRGKLKSYKEIIDKNNFLITLNINEDKKDDDENNKKTVVGVFPIEKQGVKILFNDFTGINFTKERVKEDLFKYIKQDFFYGHGLILNDNLLGNSKIDIEKLPFALYKNGQYLIEGGFINGEMVISDLNKNIGYLLFNDYDHSPVTEIQINKEEDIGIIGNILGIIYIYTIKDFFWNFKMKISLHNQKINSIFISDELNTFVSCSNDNYINIFSLPCCKVINSFYIEEPEMALLSSRPLPVCISYSNKKKKLLIYGINGTLVMEKEINRKPEYCLIYTNKNFQDYLIFGKNGNIFIYSLPYLEINRKIQIIEENFYQEYDLFIKCYKNINKNIEYLIALDRKKQILYIIGDK